MGVYPPEFDYDLPEVCDKCQHGDCPEICEAFNRLVEIHKIVSNAHDQLDYDFQTNEVKEEWCFHIFEEIMKQIGTF